MGKYRAYCGVGRTPGARGWRRRAQRQFRNLRSFRRSTVGRDSRRPVGTKSLGEFRLCCRSGDTPSCGRRRQENTLTGQQGHGAPEHCDLSVRLFRRAIWFRAAPSRASSRVCSRSTSACATVQVRTRLTDRRTRSDSVSPAERAFACHSARSASLARIFTHTSRPAPLMCRCRWGGLRGHSPRQPLPGTREAWPQRVGWLTCLTCPPCADQTGSRTSRAPTKVVHRRLQPWAVKISIPVH